MWYVFFWIGLCGSVNVYQQRLTVLLVIFRLLQSDEEIVKTVDKDLRTMLLKPDAPAPQMHGVRTWPKAIPQFTIGHLDHLESAKNALQNAKLDGLFLGGNYVVGVALGRCVEGAYESAQAISQYVATTTAKTSSV